MRFFKTDEGTVVTLLLRVTPRTPEATPSRAPQTILSARFAVATPPTKPSTPQTSYQAAAAVGVPKISPCHPSAFVCCPRDQTIAGDALLLSPTDNEIFHCSISKITEELHLRTSASQRLAVTELHRHRLPCCTIDRRRRAIGEVSYFHPSLYLRFTLYFSLLYER